MVSNRLIDNIVWTSPSKTIIFLCTNNAYSQYFPDRLSPLPLQFSFSLYLTAFVSAPNHHPPYLLHTFAYSVPRCDQIFNDDLWCCIFRSNSSWIPHIHTHSHLYIYGLYRPLFITSLFHDSPCSSQFTFRLIRLRSTINTFIYDTLTNHTFLLLMPATYIAPCHSVSLL